MELQSPLNSNILSYIDLKFNNFTAWYKHHDKQKADKLTILLYRKWLHMFLRKSCFWFKRTMYVINHVLNLWWYLDGSHEQTLISFVYNYFYVSPLENLLIPCQYFLSRLPNVRFFWWLYFVINELNLTNEV